jgi:glycosyltransferase involved in cell wall biosynthesis
LLKVKVNDTKNEISKVNSELAIKTETIKLKEGYVERMESTRCGKLASLDEDIKLIEEHEKDLLAEISNHENEIERLTNESEKVDSLQETVTKLNMFEKRFKNNIKSYNEKIKYYQEITHCPQCEQNVCDEHKALMIDNNKASIETQEIELKEVTDKIEILKSKLEKEFPYNWITWENWTDDVKKEYKQADILLITSNYEGWGLTAIEAVACGTPVVMSPVGVAKEFILTGVNGYVARGHDVINITEAIHLGLTHDFEQEKMKKSLDNLQTKREYFKKFKEMLDVV